MGLKYVRLYAPSLTPQLHPYPSSTMTSNSSQVDMDRDVGVEEGLVGDLLRRQQERDRGPCEQEVQGRAMVPDRDLGMEEREARVQDGEKVYCKVGLAEDEGAGGRREREGEMVRLGREQDRDFPVQDGPQQQQQQGAGGGEGHERAGRDQGGVGAVPPGSVYPGVAALPYYDVVLRPGQMLYIPPGWWHFVRSLSVSFSVSFWWG